jgi:hypothetical protein
VGAARPIVDVDLVGKLRRERDSLLAARGRLLDPPYDAGEDRRMDRGKEEQVLMGQACLRQSREGGCVYVDLRLKGRERARAIMRVVAIGGVGRRREERFDFELIKVSALLPLVADESHFDIADAADEAARDRCPAPGDRTQIGST